MAPLTLVPEIRKLDVQPGQTRYLFRRIDQTDLISPQRKPVGHSMSVSRELLVGIVRADVEQRCPTFPSAFECARELRSVIGTLTVGGFRTNFRIRIPTR